MNYEWDEAKNRLNIEKHGIDFCDAHEVFEGDRIVLADNRRDYGENRSIAVGHISNRIMIVVFTQRSAGVIRIISIRKANSREKKRYEDTIKN